ncbi:MAG: hypothetical protein II932_02400, partial [Treponema sp.]|nr:hypothetical protein [Treponema sp.]
HSAYHYNDILAFRKAPAGRSHGFSMKIKMRSQFLPPVARFALQMAAGIGTPLPRIFHAESRFPSV